jgi:hypothetical protein
MCAAESCFWLWRRNLKPQRMDAAVTCVQRTTEFVDVRASAVDRASLCHPSHVVQTDESP